MALGVVGILIKLFSLSERHLFTMPTTGLSHSGVFSLLFLLYVLVMGLSRELSFLRCWPSLTSRSLRMNISLSKPGVDPVGVGQASDL